MVKVREKQGKKHDNLFEFMTVRCKKAMENRKNRRQFYHQFNDFLISALPFAAQTLQYMYIRNAFASPRSGRAVGACFSIQENAFSGGFSVKGRRPRPERIQR